MRPRIYTPADHENCIDLFLAVYGQHNMHQICPPREIIHAYLTKLTEHPNASTFVYEIHDKVYAVCCGIVLEELNASGDTVKRYYVRDFISIYRTQKKMHIVDRLVKFGKKELQQNSIDWIDEKKDYFNYRAMAFREIGFEYAIHAR